MGRASLLPELDNPHPNILKLAQFSGDDGHDFLADIVDFFINLFSDLSDFWGDWNIRSVILFSLFLQIFLIIYSPTRKRTSSFFLSSVWLAYLLADWAAGYCVGLISKSEVGKSSATNQDYLITFWSPFLLLHLGGPYTISAFALEDNELWLRHLLALLFQLGTAILVFRSKLDGNTLFVPTMLVFLAGTAKYAERIAALSASSINRFRNSLVREPDAGPNYAKLMQEHSSRKQAGLPVRIIRTPEHRYESENGNLILPENDYHKEGSDDEEHIAYLKQVQEAHFFFKKFQGLIVDMIYSSADRRESHKYFYSRNAEAAYRVIEIELDFMYEFFYTKASLVGHKVWSWCKYVCVVFTMAALGFFTAVNKDGFEVADVRVTYALLYGALVLDLMAFIMYIFTDHTAALSVKSPIDSYGASYSRKLKMSFYKFFNERILARYFLCLWIPSWGKVKEGPYKGCYKLSTGFRFRRWSGSISGYDLLKYCLSQSVPRLSVKAVLCEVIRKCGGEDLADQLEHKYRNPFLRELWKCIFERLKQKSNYVVKDDAETIESICSARGEWALHNADIDREVRKSLRPFMEPNQVTFDESLLLWHIATELCYAHDPSLHFGDAHEKRISKLLSDYMLYLLVMQPNMMSAVAGIGQLRFKDTCEEAKRFFISKRNELKQYGDRKEMLRKAMGLLSDVPTQVKPSEVKGDRSKSVLFDACRLAQELNKLEGHKRWEFISSVWVELLSYAATNCRPTEHVNMLSKGGELVSFVWLLMVQLGLSTQFQIMEGDARTKLIVGVS